MRLRWGGPVGCSAMDTAGTIRRVADLGQRASPPISEWDRGWRRRRRSVRITLADVMPAQTPRVPAALPGNTVIGRTTLRPQKARSGAHTLAGFPSGYLREVVLRQS